MQSKYLIVRESNLEIPIVFNPILTHARVGGNQTVVSAGFCSRDDDGKFMVWGESVSLNLKHRAEDSEIITKYLEYNC